MHDSCEIRKGAEGGHALARDLFGCAAADGLYYSSEGTALVAALLDGASDGRAQVVALAVILAELERVKITFGYGELLEWVLDTEAARVLAGPAAGNSLGLM